MKNKTKDAFSIPTTKNTIAGFIEVSDNMKTPITKPNFKTDDILCEPINKIKPSEPFYFKWIAVT